VRAAEEVAWKIDRLSRSVADLYSIATALSAYGVKLSVVTRARL
jgi:DNA invertase Pin-like site-specific DNA recombinase